MRFLAYLLLLANLAMAAWITMQPEQQPPKYLPIPVPPGIQPLVLLSERASSIEQAAMQTDNAAANSAVGPAGVEQDQIDQAEQDPDSTVAVITPPDVTESPQPPESPAEPERVCRTVGPLMKQENAGLIAKQLEDGGYDATLRVGEVREPSGYWVYMPAMPAREARRIVAKLDANGMKDYFIGKQNYISLGIFSRKEKAQSRLDQVKALGFNPVLDQRYRTRNVYWLDLEEGDQPLLVSQTWEQIQREHADIRVQRVSCE